MTILITGLVLFLGVHFARIIAPQWRESFIATRGENTYKGAYSLISIIGFLVLIYGYSLARDMAGQAFVPPAWGRSAALMVMPVALVLLIASQLPAGYIKRAVRHPMIVSVLLWAGVHLLANGDWASVALFGAFLVWAVIDTVAAYRRPFVAPQSVSFIPDLIAVLVGLGLTFAMISFLHEWLFGMPIV